MNHIEKKSFREEMYQQIAMIKSLRRFLVKKTKKNISFEEAAMLWVSHYAEKFRKSQEIEYL